jgi:hypothetical protein
MLFSVAFVSMGNFGLLVRQRMQVVGFLLLVLFSVQTVVRGFQSNAEEPSTQAHQLTRVKPAQNAAESSL